MLASVAVIVVIALMAATAIVALRSTRHQLDLSREIDHRLAIVDHLRSETRALALSARRFILSGDLKEQQRVLSIVYAMKGEREQLDARRTLDKGAILEADLEEYIAALKHAMSFDDDDPIVRLSRFEDELVRIRSPLSSTFDEIISRERAKGDALRSAQTLARSAQWAVLLAGILGAMLVIGTWIAAPRGGAARAADPSVTRSRNELLAAANELRAPLEHIIADASQLRLRQRDSAETRALDNIATNASRVNGMLADLLDVTAIQTGTTTLRREPLDAVSLVDRAIKDHREAAHERGIRLRYEAQVAMRVFADRVRIKHVLDSLLQIAIAAARPAAELVVHIAAAEGGVRFAIIEPGPGTDAHDQHDLALQLCGRIVEAHGGRMGVQTSSISRTYWFTLPTEPALLR